MSVTVLNEANFEEVINSGKTVLVDFWATWCMPCRMLSPTVDSIAEENAETLIVGKVNVDEEQSLAGRFSVMSIPTVICFKDGKEIDRTVGVTSKDNILSMVNAVKV